MCLLRAREKQQRARGGALGVKKNDLDLIERSRKVSHFSLQATHPESSSERVLTARRYPKLGDQRFESMTKVCLADRSASMPTADHSIIVFGRCGCHHDELNPTVLKVILVSCATVAAGMSHSQMRHFEGISSLAGVEFYFACGGLRRESRRDNNMIAALVSVMRLPTRRFSRVCRQ